MLASEGIESVNGNLAAELMLEFIKCKEDVIEQQRFNRRVKLQVMRIT